MTILTALAACGDDGGSTPIDAAAVSDAAAGQVWIRGNSITGATSKIVLANVTATGGGPSMGAICAQLTTSPASFVAAARTPAMGNPCTLGAEVTFTDGTYAVAAGIYTPGMQTPDLCANTTVTVAGSGDVTLPAFAACP